MSLIAILAVCGIALSSVSLQRHYATSKTAFCDVGETFNCDIVNRSMYSTILGVPVALIGMLGYAALVDWRRFIVEARDSDDAAGRAAAGLAFALYLTYIEGHVLGVWCILCLGSLGLIALTALLSAALWWRRDAV